MPISRDDAIELIESLKRASFGSGSSRVITLEEAEAAVWNHTEDDGRPLDSTQLLGENRADSRDASPLGENRG